jgi:hypothetical protein
VAKVTNPLHSLSASGSIGGVVTFRNTNNGAVVTNTPRPYAATTPAQLIQQGRMKAARTAWGALNAADLRNWRKVGKKYGRSAWASFFTEYQFQNVTAPGAPLIPEVNL